MQKMKQLKKIRLINWHFFHDHTIDLNGNILLTGENGSGKSTLLDAIQFVLTAGKARFNLAANENAKRSLESYMRGKTGREGAEYLRNGDVISQIALEYYDDVEKDSFVIGALLELSKGGKARKRFYVLHHCGLIDKLFIDEHRQVLSFKLFQRELKVRKIVNEISEKQFDSQMMFRNVLGVSRKYHTLLPKALAFQPINDLNKFIFDFLLNEDPIQLDGLRENIRQYRHLETIMKDQKKRYEMLQSLMGTYDKYQKQVEKLDKQKHLLTMINYESNLKEKDTLELRKNEHQNQITFYQQQANLIKQQMDKVEQDYIDTRTALNGNDGYRLYEELINKQKQSNDQYTELKTQFQGFWNDYQKELKVLSDLRYTHTLPLSKDKLLESKELSLQLQQMCQQMEDKKNQMLLSRSQKKAQFESCSIELKDVQEEIKGLQNKQFTYSFELTKLIDILKTRLYEHTGEYVEIRPFCEYLEINDEKWRNAVEGYLNTQRFDLIVEPKYFNFCARIYERYKDEHKIYGVGVVNTGKLQVDEVNEHSLASKVDAINPYARQYANMLMNHVDLEEDVEKMKEHKIAITPSCMIYRNVTLRSIHPKIYTKPYIGQQAIKIQLSQKKEREKELQEEISVLRKSIYDYSRLIDKITNSKLRELEYQSKTILTTYVQVETELKELKKRIAEMKKDASWITLEEQINVLDERRKKLQLEFNEQNGKVKENEFMLESVLDSLEKMQEALAESQVKWHAVEEQYPELLPDLNQEYDKQRKAYRNDFKRMIQATQDRIVRFEDQLHIFIRDVKDCMHEYNQYSSHGLGESLEDMVHYQNQYYKLKDIELDETLRKITEAQAKAESSFQEDFISRLRDKITHAKTEIKKLNNTLKERSFNGERYEFIINPNKNPDYKPFYDVIMSGEDYHANSLFMDELNESNRNLMQKLFNQLSHADTNGKSESLLHQYTDYRQYLSYDIKIHHDENSFTLFSKVSKEKSGGETQTPYYVTIAASFEQLLQVRRMQASSGCLVMLDEAFNNMDESRIEAMMQFYSDLNIQLLIAVPPSRIHTIAPYADTVLTLVKKDRNVLVGSFAYENS